MKLVILACICFAGFSVYAEDENVVKAILDEPSAVAEKHNLTWNKWETDNFIILSIEKSQGLVLKGAVESLKDDHFSRWGMKNQKLPIKCKLVCVPDAKMLKKFFGIDRPRVEVRRDGASDPALCAIWIDFQSMDELPSLISSAFASNKNRHFVQRGISMLSLPPDKIARELSQASQVKFAEVSTCLLEKWISMGENEKALFDRNSALVCLMLRKEFGEQKFIQFLSSNQDEDSIKMIYGFKNLMEFDGTLGRYLENLKKDIGSGATPDSYLTVKGARK